jgi:transcription elongation factor GreA
MNANGKVIFGATVELNDLESDTTVTYKIVGDDEADIKQGLISYSSPLARAIIGKSEGDDVEFEAPGGVKEYEICTVSYI